ncbi:hypothetical protein HRG_006255 [Hirsutella rhossiliensis]|uniref:Uncharacterized protein n=1 Tax=Hirsutella rhossiliensis TaxID=111463 RepID=A0A9P8MYQ7_9HYPO|nr:uncharacterized protein HRG_06255 [Hirsutella rhossiliensis]KAH0963745.1 hypothetical protein HRG_06255 [Hirsutella rhossiliensis]
MSFSMSSTGSLFGVEARRNNHEDPMTISELSQKCEQAFEVICEDPDARAEAPDGKVAGREKLLEVLGREQGRVRIWARNIDALRDPTSTSSLGSRLHDAPKVRNTIASVLEGLLESLEIVFGILKGDLPNRAAAIAVMDAGASQSNTTELKELALDIRSSITDLFRYSMFLRRQRSRGREVPTEAERREPDASLDNNFILRAPTRSLQSEMRHFPVQLFEELPPEIKATGIAPPDQLQTAAPGHGLFQHAEAHWQCWRAESYLPTTSDHSRLSSSRRQDLQWSANAQAWQADSPEVA